MPIWKRRRAIPWSPCSKYFQPSSTASGAKCFSSSPAGGSARLLKAERQVRGTRIDNANRTPQKSSRNRAPIAENRLNHLVFVLFSDIGTASNSLKEIWYRPERSP